MNYKELVRREKEERLDNNSDHFYSCFLDMVHMVQTYSKMLKNCDPIVRDAIKHRIKGDVVTLKCFMRCCK